MDAATYAADRCSFGGDAASAAGPAALPSVLARTLVRNCGAPLFGAVSSAPGCPTPGSSGSTGALNVSSSAGDPTSWTEKIGAGQDSWTTQFRIFYGYFDELQHFYLIKEIFILSTQCKHNFVFLNDSLIFRITETCIPPTQRVA